MGPVEEEEGMTGGNTPGAKPGALPDEEPSAGLGAVAAGRGNPEPGGADASPAIPEQTAARKERGRLGLERSLSLFHI